MATPSLGGGGLSASDVLAYAQRVSQTRQDVGVNMCQRFVRMAFGSSGGASTALQAWQQSTHKHTSGEPRVGAAVYWGGGNAGHVAIYAGNGMVYSTDVRSPGHVDLVDMDYITKQWGKPLLGWSDSTNEKTITRWDAKPVAAGSGGGGKVAYSTTAGGGVATKVDEQRMKEEYGHLYAIYGDIPEVKRLIDAATKGGWTTDKFEARLRGTDWFRKHTESQKAFQVLEAEQPKEAANQIAKAKMDIQNLQRQMGVPVTPERLDKLARRSVVMSWSPQQLKNALTAELDFNPEHTYGGVVGQTVNQFRQMASSYLTPISNKTTEKWVDNVLRGEATPADFESYLKAQAKSLFPELADAIDRGVTVDQYLDPYREMAAKELEINPDDVDWMSPKWSQAVFQTDAKGGRRPMGLADWQRTIRTDPKYGFDHTVTGRDTAAQFASSLLTEFGKG